MKKIVLVFLSMSSIASGLVSSSGPILFSPGSTVWQENHRISLPEQAFAQVANILSGSVAVYYSGTSRWLYAVMPLLGAIQLAPSVWKGLLFASKTTALQKNIVYTDKDNQEIDPFLKGVNRFMYKGQVLATSHQLWQAYKKDGDDFLVGLCAYLHYHQHIQALPMIDIMKKEIVHTLAELESYTDITVLLEEKYGQPVVAMPPENYLVMLEGLDAVVEQVSALGTYKQFFRVDQQGKLLPYERGSQWYADDFVYTRATAYASELIKQYGRLLILEKILKPV